MPREPNQPNPRTNHLNAVHCTHGPSWCWRPRRLGLVARKRHNIMILLPMTVHDRRRGEELPCLWIWFSDPTPNQPPMGRRISQASARSPGSPPIHTYTHNHRGQRTWWPRGRDRGCACKRPLGFIGKPAASKQHRSNQRGVNTQGDSRHRLTEPGRVGESRRQHTG
jgi:hypothetical protein